MILRKYCGHAKLNQHDDALFLHPFEMTDIEDYFSYDLDIEDYLDLNQPELPKFYSMLKQLFFV